jgi:hypothetical protein
VLLSGICVAQTTQGLITGQVVDSITGKPVAGAQLLCSNLVNDSSRDSTVADSGIYYLPFLSPGPYRIRIEAAAYQAQEVYDLELPVAGRLEVNFRLRPLNDVWQQGEYRSVLLPASKLMVTFYGPDLDESKSEYIDGKRGQSGALESTVSYVVDPQQISDLPLAGRDVYTMLLTLPGVVSDSATSRGLGLAAAGQRPSSSNFLLDGVQNNNYLVTGPLAPVAPEAIQEYRVSTNNFSAEYGQTSGYMANAVTRAGGSQFHGIGYFYLRNDVLNANGFQENRAGDSRNPDKEDQFGFQAGGPLFKAGLFWSSAFEELRSRTRLDPVVYRFPTAFAISQAAPGSDAQMLLSRYAAPAVTPLASDSLTGLTTLTPPVSVDRWLGLQRVDYQRGPDQLLARLSIARVSRPDFIWSPYPDFTSGLDENTVSLAFGYQRTISPQALNEAKFAYSSDSLSWHRENPQIPTLSPRDGTRAIPVNTTLPGSPAVYSYQNKNHYWEAIDNFTWTRGAHLITVGGGFLYRTLGGFLDYLSDGEFFFFNTAAFLQDQPYATYQAVLRGTTQQPDYRREYHEGQWSGFAQDTWRIGHRLTLNYGVRFERYGGPRNTGGAADTIVSVQPGTTVWQPNTLSLMTSRGQLYPSNNDWAPRFGISYDVFGSGRTIVRGGYGLFYDHPFDNLWQTIRNNSLEVPIFPLDGTVDYLAGPASVLSNLSSTPGSFPDLTMFDPKFKNGYAQTYFVGVEERITPNWTLQVNGTGSLGRHLITTDIINRDFTTPDGRLNPNLPYDVDYRAPQGSSSYNALTALTRFRTSRLQTQLAYTWSHAIDNQSEALGFDVFNLFFSALNTGGAGSIASFSRQFDSSSDHGNSDFDQRHNVVMFAVWDVPPALQASRLRGAFRNWRVSGLAAFRSGFPYSVFYNSPTIPGEGLIEHNRADVIDPAAVYVSGSVPVAGGQQLLNKTAFAPAPASTLGNSGRNAFYGPGLSNFDFSLSRSFGVPRLGESSRFTLRADAFNLLNHSNLNNPENLLGQTTFGRAQFGRTGQPSGFPAIFPLNETGRQIQMLLRLEW